MLSLWARPSQGCRPRSSETMVRHSSTSYVPRSVIFDLALTIYPSLAVYGGEYRHLRRRPRSEHRCTHTANHLFTDPSEWQIFFFWNRILGGIVGFALRRYLWKTSEGHISIGMPFSPLRIPLLILFREFRFLTAVASRGTDPVQGCAVPFYQHVCACAVGTHYVAILEMANP